MPIFGLQTQHSTATEFFAQAPSASIKALAGGAFPLPGAALASFAPGDWSRKKAEPCETRTPLSGGTKRMTSESKVSTRAVMGCDAWTGGMDSVTMGYCSSKADARG